MLWLAHNAALANTAAPGSHDGMCVRGALMPQTIKMLGVSCHPLPPAVAAPNPTSKLASAQRPAQGQIAQHGTGSPKSCEMMMVLFGCITITNAFPTMDLRTWGHPSSHGRCLLFEKMLRGAKQCLTHGK